ncbi:MAG: NAD(P)/FAD-dependent oxidoreductase [Planctomycetes bacterium]|nr:NAD(P)/FAD-dependent oxidoreductase [Planctomycetota bacterium]
METESTYDGIVLGTGHNALVLQAYLSRAGLHCLSIDRASTPGGGLATIENPRQPGFLHNTHSFFHRAITSMPWFDDLDLELHGVRYVEPELNVAMILPDGRVLQWWTDPEKTIRSFEDFSKRDAAKLREWIEEFEPIVEELIVPEGRSPPLPPDQRTQLLERTTRGRRLLEVSQLSPLEFVTREFEHDAIRAGLLFFNGLREIDLRLKGFGHSIPALLASRHKAQMCIGGSGRLAKALVADIEAHGGKVLYDVEIAQLVEQSGRVIGVELKNGDRLTARSFVASGLNPQQTFLDLLTESAVSKTLKQNARDFRYNLLAPLFALNLALREPPKYTAAKQHPELARAFMVILGLESFEQFHSIVNAHEDGRFPPTVAWGACPTLFDQSQAPAGKHTAFLWEKLPFRIEGDPQRWDEVGKRHADDLLSFWSQYAPNLKETGVVLDQFHTTPLDTTRDLPNMREGDLLVGSFDDGQVGYHRPFPGAGNYRTPLDGLYLCGGSTHPGGNITGLCGYNAARVITADLNMQPWWTPHDTEPA